MKRILSLLLLLCIAVSCAASFTQTYAEPEQKIQGEYSQSLDLTGNENVEYVKNDDGTVTAYVYTAPFRRKNAEGKWCKIDNTLAQSSKNEDIFSTNDGYFNFTKTIKPQGEIYSIRNDKYEISCIMPEENRLSAYSQAEIVSEKDSTFFEIFGNSSTIIEYNEIMQGVDLQYIIKDNDLKENIIISEYLDDYTFSFYYRLEGLKLADNNGRLYMADSETGEEVFAFDSLYMYDSSEKCSVSDAVKISYKLLDEDYYEISIQADSEWIQDKDRTFPIVIDPSVTSSVTANASKDSEVRSNNPDTNYSTNSSGVEMTIMYMSDAYTPFLATELPEIIKGSDIVDAKFVIKYYYYVSSGYLDAGVHNVLADWEESSITYNNSIALGSVDSKSIDTQRFTASSSVTGSNPGIAEFDITELAKQWAIGYSVGNRALCQRIIRLR